MNIYSEFIKGYIFGFIIIKIKRQEN